MSRPPERPARRRDGRFALSRAGLVAAHAAGDVLHRRSRAHPRLPRQRPSRSLLAPGRHGVAPYSPQPPVPAHPDHALVAGQRLRGLPGRPRSLEDLPPRSASRGRGAGARPRWDLRLLEVVTKVRATEATLWI